MKNLVEIIETIKKIKNLKTDIEVALTLNIKDKTLATAKTRNSIPFEELFTFCKKENILLDWLLMEEDGKFLPMRISKELEDYNDFVFVPQVTGQISAGGGAVPQPGVEMMVAFRKDWIERKGNPKMMSLIRVSGDSMAPTLQSGDLILVDHSRDHFDPQGGIYAIHINESIIIKRVQILFEKKKIKIISDNSFYEPFEVDPKHIKVNGKVIWYGRELEK